MWPGVVNEPLRCRGGGRHMTIIWKQSLGLKSDVSLYYRARNFVPYEAWLRHGHRRARAAYQGRLSHNGELDDLYQELRVQGVAQRHLGYFGAPYEAMVAAADRLCLELAAQPVEGARFRDVPDDERLLAEAEPFLFALSGRLLDLAERYMGLSVRYFGVAVKREIASGVLEGTRHFHMDPEDENVLKIIVYLNDSMPGPGLGDSHVVGEMYLRTVCHYARIDDGRTFFDTVKLRLIC